MIRLSRREREVADLVAEGLTNREIAERLFISERTAEGHIQQIRNKLGFTARTQIAAWVIEQNLGGRPAAAPDSPRSAAPPAAGRAGPGPPLPVPLTSFIGRERELHDLKTLLGATRLVTLTGPAGSGKTRLALQLAGECLERYPDGISFIDVAPLSEPQLVPRAAISALGITEQPGQMHLQTLVVHIGRRRPLLLLDNCEHLVDACASFAERLLSACPGLSLLATSREGLRVAGEAVWPVHPLPVPPVDLSRGLDQVAAYDAVRLFANLATLNLPSFAASAKNIEIAAEICRRLDGIPLAIELAAARVGSMPPEQILKRLENRFQLLTTGSRTAAARQQTLEAAVRWSYELLNEEQRRLFRGLSVFTGGFQLESAEAVCAGEGLESENIASMVSDLVDRSLVVFEPKADGTGRYRMLETLRQYGRERLLESGDAPLLQSRHFDHFLALAQSTQPRRIRLWERLGVLDQELDNLRAALDWSRTMEGDAELRLAVPFGALCFSRGYLIEGRERLESALQRVRCESGARAEAFSIAGQIALRAGDHAASVRHYEQGLRFAQEPEVAWAIRDALGTTLPILGRLHEARVHLEKALEIAEEQGMAGPRAAILSGLANLEYEEGNFAAARTIATASLSICRELGLVRVTAMNLKLLGEICLRVGTDTGGARTHFSDSLQLVRQMGDSFALAFTLDDIAWLAAAESQPVRALRLAGAASALRESIGAAPRPDFQRRVAGGIERARGVLAPAERGAAWEEGRSMAWEDAIAYALAEDG